MRVLHNLGNDISRAETSEWNKAIVEWNNQMHVHGPNLFSHIF